MADSDDDDLPAAAEGQSPHDEFTDDLSPAEWSYNEKEYSKRVLFSMCIGLISTTGDPLVDLSMAPWSTLKKKKLIKPSLKDLIDEIGRRSTVEGHPRCANWQQKRCKDWLEKNPIIEDEDVEFLKRETSRFLNTIEEAESWSVGKVMSRRSHRLIASTTNHILRDTSARPIPIAIIMS